MNSLLIRANSVATCAVVSQVYDTDVNKEYVIRGNAAVLKCQVPSFVADFVTVVSWHTDLKEDFYPSSELGNFFRVGNWARAMKNYFFWSNTDKMGKPTTYLMEQLIRGYTVLIVRKVCIKNYSDKKFNLHIHGECSRCVNTSL